MPLRDSLVAVLAEPTADRLWTLRADLLEAEVPAGAGIWSVLDRFHEYVDRLATGLSSRDYSNLASKMDISAVGGVVLEQILETEDPLSLANRLFSGLISEGLMVLATRQHVKAWEGELGSVYRAAAWGLYEELWKWTSERNPSLEPAERRRLIERLLAPLHAAETPPPVKAILIGRLFQVLLAAHVTRVARA